MVVYYKNIELANNVKSADTFFTRLVGLLNKKHMDNNDGLLLTNCSAIHCFFMKFAIDALYLNKDMTVLYKETISPWKIGKIVKGTSHVLELSEGAAIDILIGEMLEIKE
jgi:uncharacterized membrane protein (UPF0127 family)